MGLNASIVCSPRFLVSFSSSNSVSIIHPTGFSEFIKHGASSHFASKSHAEKCPFDGDSGEWSREKKKEIRAPQTRNRTFYPLTTSSNDLLMSGGEYISPHRHTSGATSLSLESQKLPAIRHRKKLIPTHEQPINVHLRAQYSHHYGN